MRPLSKFLQHVPKVVNGPSSYPTGGFVVDVGELTVIEKATGRYIGDGDYAIRIITPAQDDTLKPNQLRVKVLTKLSVSYTINEAGTATVDVVVGEEVANGTDLSSEQFEIEAYGY